MTQLTAVQNTPLSAESMEQILIKGDLSALNSQQRVQYMVKVCEMVGLNPLTKPFEFITLNSKLVLYAKRDATDQLRSIKKVSVKITARETIEGVYVVTAQARLPDGREDESTGAVTITGLKGDFLANAMMKSETKAKRRVTLSICGLGMLDETEVETIPGASGSGYIFPTQPDPEDGHRTVTKYLIPFGKFAQRSLEEIDPKELGKYVEYLENTAQRTGKPLSENALDLIKRATDYLAAMENSYEVHS